MNQTNETPFLFRELPNLKQSIPWIKLLPSSTPVKQMKNMQDKLEIENLWIKKDGLTFPDYGGNKPRKLEFILGDAIEKGYTEVLSTGGIGSNYCIANAASCRKVGLQPIAVLVDQPINQFVKNNLLLHLHFGTNLIYAKKRSRIKWIKMIKSLIDRNIYFMLTPGGSVPLGTLGFVNAAFELKDQIENNELPDSDFIFLPCGSAGTVAGLALGLKLAELKSKIVSIKVSTFTDDNGVLNLAEATKKYLQEFDPTIPDVKIDNIIFEDNFLGEGYGIPTQEGLKAIKIIKEQENINLETTYTGKTLAALLDFVEKNRTEIKKKSILFWNTFNSRDYSEILSKLNYKDLPKNLHWVFEKSIT
jgi:D-cysteine desulfhydrase